MKVIKNINNNVALCVDANGVELIAFGKGIGFKKPPYDIDLSQVKRTYYSVDESYIHMLSSISKEIIQVSEKIIFHAESQLSAQLNPNIVFTLSDHINFAITRFNENIDLSLPILHDVKQLHNVEYSIGEYALDIISTDLGVNLPRDEAAYIALHIINAEAQRGGETTKESSQKLIHNITKIIELELNITINKNSSNYSRFVSHIHYLLKRAKHNEQIRSSNNEMYELLVDSHPETFICSKKISEYLETNLNWKLTKEEKLYLILHLNRLHTRQEYDQ